MIEDIHILGTCRNPDLVQNCLITLKTIKVGFPNSNVIYHVNGQDTYNYLQKSKDVSMMMQHQIYNVHPSTTHGKWIEELIYKYSRPFWICDTDVIFHSPVRINIQPDAAIAGRYEPTFINPIDEFEHKERIHPSLMYINPVRCRNIIDTFTDRLNSLKGFIPNPINLEWHWRLENGKLSFVDTMGQFYEMFREECQVFTDEENLAFDHLYNSTYADLIPENIGFLTKKHRAAAFHNPTLMKGIYVQQQEWFQKHGIKAYA